MCVCVCVCVCVCMYMACIDHICGTVHVLYIHTYIYIYIDIYMSNPRGFQKACGSVGQVH